MNHFAYLVKGLTIWRKKGSIFFLIAYNGCTDCLLPIVLVCGRKYICFYETYLYN